MKFYMVRNKINEYNKGKGKWIVLYYADWCGFCHSFLPVWKEFEKQKSKTNKIKIEMKDFSKLNYNPEIEGYPTVHLYNDGKLIKVFKNERTIEGLNSFIKDNKKRKSKKKKKSRIHF